MKKAIDKLYLTTVQFSLRLKINRFCTFSNREINPRLESLFQNPDGVYIALRPL